MMSFSAMGTVGIVYVLWGYSMSFAGNVFGGLFGNPWTVFGLAGLGLTGDDPNGITNSFDAGVGRDRPDVRRLPAHLRDHHRRADLRRRSPTG